MLGSLAVFLLIWHSGLETHFMKQPDNHRQAQKKEIS
jgi:hypothetical protein